MELSAQLVQEATVGAMRGVYQMCVRLPCHSFAHSRRKPFAQSARCIPIFHPCAAGSYTHNLARAALRTSVLGAVSLSGPSFSTAGHVWPPLVPSSDCHPLYYLVRPPLHLR
jgi:hypothetical protein